MKEKCAVADCQLPREGRLHCGAHRRRLRIGAPLDAPVRGRETFEERYTIASSGCWEWHGPLSGQGYGMHGKRWAHRLSYEASVGPIPEGYHVDHLCRVRHCVNPEHLEAVTPGENARRMWAAKWAEHGDRCLSGEHEFTPENTAIRKDGARLCRACDARRSREYKARRQAS